MSSDLSYGEQLALALTPKITSCLSIPCSAFIIYEVYRDHKRRRQEQRRARRLQRHHEGRRSRRHDGSSNNGGNGGNGNGNGSGTYPPGTGAWRRIRNGLCRCWGDGDRDDGGDRDGGVVFGAAAPADPGNSGSRRVRGAGFNVNGVVQRSLVGMSCIDILASSGWFLSTWTAPKGSILFASGNEATCNFQGFLLQLAVGAPLYNCSLSLYYLLVIKYNWSQDRLLRIERWVHGAVLAFSAGTGFLLLPLGQYNHIGAVCWVIGSPPDCENSSYRGDPDIECDRGNGAWLYGIFLFYGPLWVCVFFTVVAMIVITVQVRRTHRRLRRYEDRFHQYSMDVRNSHAGIVAPLNDPGNGRSNHEDDGGEGGEGNKFSETASSSSPENAESNDGGRPKPGRQPSVRFSQSQTAGRYQRGGGGDGGGGDDGDERQRRRRHPRLGYRRGGGGGRTPRRLSVLRRSARDESMVVTQALLYSMSFFLTWMPSTIWSVAHWYNLHSFWFDFFSSLCEPLQGLWNCLVFIRNRPESRALFVATFSCGCGGFDGDGCCCRCGCLGTADDDDEDDHDEKIICGCWNTAKVWGGSSARSSSAAGSGSNGRHRSYASSHDDPTRFNSEKVSEEHDDEEEEERDDDEERRSEEERDEGGGRQQRGLQLRGGCGYEENATETTTTEHPSGSDNDLRYCDYGLGCDLADSDDYADDSDGADDDGVLRGDPTRGAPEYNVAADDKGAANVGIGNNNGDDSPDDAKTEQTAASGSSLSSSGGSVTSRDENGRKTKEEQVG